MNLIQNTLSQFNKVSLPDLDKVKLMNRTDKKFCLHISKLHTILEAIRADYLVLEIQEKTIFNYDNTYFDTPDNQMYLNHHNGKLNRYKIRVRNYTLSNDNFLEIKFKNNKERTIKNRIERAEFDSIFTSAELSFIKQASPFHGSQLEPKIRSNFSRITLVNNNFTERVTLDLVPGFENQEMKITLNNLVIVEVKQGKSSDSALITKTLQAHKIANQGFSKYCIGRSLLEDKIKKNNFKPLLLKISKEYAN